MNKIFKRNTSQAIHSPNAARLLFTLKNSLDSEVVGKKDKRIACVRGYSKS